MKRWLIYILIFLLGAASGIVGAFYYGVKSFINTASLTHLFYRVEMLEAVLDAYLNESPDVAVWALNTGIRYMEKEAEMVDLSDDRGTIIADLVLVYARLALTHRKMGNDAGYEMAMARAMELVDESNLNDIQSSEALIRLVERLDVNIQSKGDREHDVKGF